VCLLKLLVHTKKAQITLVSWFERLTLHNFKNQDALAANPHWANQGDFCGGLGNLSKYDFVGRLENDMNGQVRKMLHEVGANETEADAFFPESGTIGHNSSSVVDPNTFLQNVSIMTAIQSMYSRDYDMMARHFLWR